MIKSFFLNVALWILRKYRREQKAQQEQMEHIILQKKKYEDAIAHEEWKEKFDRAYKECSSYGKKKTYKRSYHRSKKPV